MAGGIVIVGAGGEMARTVAGLLASRLPDVPLVLCDLDERRLAAVASGLPEGRATTRRLDLFDPAGLRDAIRGARIVVNGAGPFMRTAEPVIEACVEEGVDYLDYDDDPASTLAAIGHEERLAASGIRCYKNCGHSPGMTNVIAVDVAERLDEVHTLDVLWALGDEGAYEYGRAVIEHWLEVIHGPVPTWRDGAMTTVDAFAASDVYPLAGGLGEFRLHEVGHPEPITLPRRFPQARSIRCMGGLHPQPVNGLSRGITVAIERGDLSMDEAITWIQLVFNDEHGSLKVWRHALAGVWAQVRRGEVDARTLADFLWRGLRNRHWPWLGAAAVRATGTRDGRPVRVMRRTPAPGPASTMWTSLASCTGYSAAAFTTLALDRTDLAGGLLFPEDWVTPAALYGALTDLGVPRHDVIEPDVLEDRTTHTKEQLA